MHASDFDTYLGVILDDLSAVYHIRRNRSGSEALNRSWEVYDDVFEEGMNLSQGGGAAGFWD